MFKIIVPSIDKSLSEETMLNLKSHGFDSTFHDGSGYESFSKLINECIVSNDKNITIICNDKSRPKKEHVDYMISKINEGFGFVGLFRFGFFAINIDLINKIGFFDERYIGGGYEDEDFLIRMLEANVACICTEEIDYINLPSRWKYDFTSDSKTFFYKKWRFKNDDKLIIRKLEEVNNYKLNECNSNFLEWENSKLTKIYIKKFLNSKVGK